MNSERRLTMILGGKISPDTEIFNAKHKAELEAA